MDRRGALGALVAAAGAWAGARPAAAVVPVSGAAGGVDWDDPAQRLAAVVRTLGRSDGGIALRWTDGVLSARIDAATTPLFRVLSQIFSRFRRRPDGAWDAVLFEFVYFADLETRALLETWRNPFTGDVVPVPQTTLGPTRLTYLPTLDVTRPPMPGLDLRFDHHVLVEGQSGDDLWITERLDSVMPSPAPGVPDFGFHEAFTFHVSSRARADRSRTCAGAGVQKFNVLGWRPWMAMGTRPGVTVTRGFGRVAADLQDIPPRFRELNAGPGRALLEGIEGILEL
jgi:hypothetical protein